MASPYHLGFHPLRPPDTHRRRSIHGEPPDPHDRGRLPAPVGDLVLGLRVSTPLLECDAVGSVTPVCGFQNPEDLVDLGPDWILISQMTHAGTPGNLVAFRPADGSRQVLWPTDGAEAPAGKRRRV